jgi:hypothetical protein
MSSLSKTPPAVNVVPAAVEDPEIAQHAAEYAGDRLEAIAKDIESLQATAILHVAERLAEAREIFRYRRDEGGFAGWVESRLRFSRQTAYNLLHVHERFGGQSVKYLDTFPASILYLLAAPSTPEATRTEIVKRVEVGEAISHAEVKNIVENARAISDQPARKDGSPERRRRDKEKKRARGGDTVRLDETPDKTAIEAPAEAPTAARDNTGPESAGELARLDELENEERQLEIKNIGLQSEIDELKAAQHAPAGALVDLAAGPELITADPATVNGQLDAGCGTPPPTLAVAWAAARTGEKSAELAKLDVPELLRLLSPATRATINARVVEHLTVEDHLAALERKLPETPKVSAAFKALEKALRPPSTTKSLAALREQGARP